MWHRVRGVARRRGRLPDGTRHRRAVGWAAWGGAHPGVLPGPLRAASTAGAAAWFGAATVAAGAVGGDTARRRVLRGTTGFAGLSVLLNAASRSRLERAIWVPLTILGAALGVLALRETPRR
jgi:hypothetical protein